MRKIIWSLTINKSFVFDGSREDFFQNLNDIKSINYEVVTFEEIELSPDVSYGTLFLGSYGYGISVKAFLSQNEDNQLKINFKTKVRPEHYLIAVMIIGCYAILPIFEKQNWLYLYLFGIWIVCHFWFQFFYRYQENHVIENLVSKMGLEKI